MRTGTRSTCRPRARRFIGRRLCRTSALAAAVALIAAVPAAADTGEQPKPIQSMWTYFPMPTPHSGPCLTTAGPDGAQWIEENFANKIARIDLDNGEIHEWPVPRFYGGSSGGDAGAERPIDLNGTPEGVPHFTCAMMNGDDGFMYFSNGTPNQIVRLDPWTKKMDVYNAPDWWGNLEPYNDVTLGKDHAVYFTEGATNKIGRVDLATHEVTDYPIPTPNCAPFVIRANTEGKYIWWG